jgi:hypothetical protein
VRAVEILDHIWLIAAIVYVLGMFPLFYVYNIMPLDRFGSLAQSLTLVSITGAVIVLTIHMLVAAWGKSPKDEDL